jgi:hypothetical protein
MAVNLRIINAAPFEPRCIEANSGALSVWTAISSSNPSREMFHLVSTYRTYTISPSAGLLGVWKPTVVTRQQGTTKHDDWWPQRRRPKSGRLIARLSPSEVLDLTGMFIAQPWEAKIDTENFGRARVGWTPGLLERRQ